MGKTELLITFNGETRNVSEWGRILGINRSTIAYRIKNGWDIKKALTEPVENAPNRKRTDIIGRTFDRLIVIRDSGQRQKDNGAILYECKCKCGNTIFTPSTFLLNGRTKSCGCFHREITSVRAKSLLENMGSEMLKKAIEVDCKEGTKLSSLTAKKGKRNTTGHKGVSYDKWGDRYRAFIGFKGETIRLGDFKSLDDAIKARARAEEKIFDPILDKYGKPNTSGKR